MLRWLYIQLIWLHPAPFRWRFGDDMLDDFDRARGPARPRYLADAVVSLGRQWLLRPEYRRPGEQPAALQAAGVPLFQTIETYRPRPAALLQGGLLATLSILLAVMLISKAGGMARPFLIGAHGSNPGLLHVDRESVAASRLDTTVQVGSDPSAPRLGLARRYFASMPVLLALDADGDLTLSPWEIAAAPAALRKLDTDGDGKLTPEECGLRIDPDSLSPPLLAQLRRRFMSSHPVLAALDAGRLGEISAAAIASAPSSLRKLDRNRDGYLTAVELLPPEMTARVRN